MKKFGLELDRAMDSVLGGIIGGIVGARAYYVLLSWNDYKDNLKTVFYIRQGGLAIYGGIIGGILIGGLVAKWRKVKFETLLDVGGLGFLIGQGIGRWGNFTNQEAFGVNTSPNNIFAMSGGTVQSVIFSENSSLLSKGMTVFPTKTVHPCFLYEFLWCLLGFCFLAWYSKRRRFDGQLFLMYLAWYGTGRFFIEGLRSDSLMVSGIRVSQVLAGLLAVCSVSLIIFILIKTNGKGYPLYCTTAESKAILLQAQRRAEKRANEEGFQGSEQDEEMPDFDAHHSSDNSHDIHNEDGDAADIADDVADDV